MTSITNSAASNNNDRNETGLRSSASVQASLRDIAVLERINDFLKLLGSTAQYIMLPEVSEKVTQNLSDKKIMIIDDNRRVLERWVPELVAATKGKADMYWHNSAESTNPALVVNDIELSNPDIILLDYELCNGLKGSDLVAGIKEKLPKAIIIGFSSDSGFNYKLEEAGTDGSAPKSASTEEAFDHIIFHVNRVETERKSSEARAASEKNLFSLLNNSLNSEQVDQWIDKLSQHVKLKKTAAEFLELPYSEEKANEFGSKRFKITVNKLAAEGCKPFEKLMTALGDMPYYDSELRQAAYMGSDFYSCKHEILAELKQYLPEEIQKVVSSDKIINASFIKNDFALLFSDENSLRRIITKDKLIQLSDVFGYPYLDLSKQGEPFARSVTSRDGKRAFFDGKRLMSHPSFQTCAPKVSFFEGGYIVNSTNCSIVNGRLYPLISEFDAVSHTTGAGPFGMLDFTLDQALLSYQMNDALAKFLKISADGVIELPNRKVYPLGEFEDSIQIKLDNGFTQYEWANFKAD
jgi:DNA-binding NarL/FixJ family response regulator